MLDNSYEKELNKMKCFCGSHKNFLKCCKMKINQINIKDYNEDKERDILKFIKNTMDNYNKSKEHNCLYKNCNRKATSLSHKMQRKGILDEIVNNINENIYNVKYNIINNNIERKDATTIKKATTFYGFCGKCDNDVFEPIENDSFYKKITNSEFNLTSNDYTNLSNADEDYIYLLIYRNISKEIFDLKNIFYTLKELLNEKNEYYEYALFFINKNSDIILKRIYLYYTQLEKMLEIKKTLENQQLNSNFKRDNYKYKFVIPYARKLNNNSLYTTSFIINSIVPFYPDSDSIDFIKSNKLNYFMNIFIFNRNEHNYIFCMYLYDKDKNNKKILDGHFNIINYLSDISHSSLNPGDFIQPKTEKELEDILDKGYYIGEIITKTSNKKILKKLNKYNNSKYLLYKCSVSLEFSLLSKILNNNLNEIYFNENVFNKIKNFKFKEKTKFNIMTNNYLNYIYQKNIFLYEYHTLEDYIKIEDLYDLCKKMPLNKDFSEEIFLEKEIVNFIYLKNENIKNPIKIFKIDTLIENPSHKEVSLEDILDYMNTFTFNHYLK